MFVLQSDCYDEFVHFECGYSRGAWLGFFLTKLLESHVVVLIVESSTYLLSFQVNFVN